MREEEGRRLFQKKVNEPYLFPIDPLTLFHSEELPDNSELARAGGPSFGDF